MRGRIVLAVILLVVGISGLLNAIGYGVFPGGIGVWWPSILIILGLVQIVANGKEWRGGVVLLGLGAILQAWTLDLLPDRWWVYAAPAALIALALLLLLPPYTRAPSGWRETARTQWRAEHGGQGDLAIFSDHQTRPEGEWRGGELTSVFGNLRADLTQVKLPPEGASMKATGVFGGVDVRVPPGWRVEMKGVPVFGRVRNETRPPPDGPVLRVEAVGVFGHVDVAN